MATKAPLKTPAPAAASSAKAGLKTITRKRRNSLMRKSLPKYLKVLFKGSDHMTFRAVLAAWQESRKKVSPRESN